MRKLSPFMLLIFFSGPLTAQFSLYRPNSAIEFSGNITAFYNLRFYDSGATDKSKNRFELDYAVFRLDGIHNKVWNYQLQINNAALIYTSSSDGFLMQADVAYNSLNDALSIDAGFNKVPFCRSSLIPNTESPFLQRPGVARGGVFNRRDAGVTVRYSMMNKLINFYGGAYTGIVDPKLEGENDPSGKLEYIGRIELSYPARFRYREVDLSSVPVPMIALGANARAAEKKLTSGGDYPYQTLDGKKLGYGGDVTIAWKGFSAMAELVHFKMTPNDSLLLLGKPTDYFKAGGVVLSANYFSRPIHSVFAIRYDTFNPNDLIIGDTESTLSFAYNYLFDSQRAALKIHYFKRIKDKDASKVWSDDQMRMALQLQF